MATGADTPSPTVNQAVAAPARPNVLVIETDDQTLESMRVMDNVNSLIGDQGATFRNSFVNYALCCPSRATFLTGQYVHNHRVLGNKAPSGGFDRFQALHGGNHLAVWLRHAGYYTAMIGRYLNGYVFRPLVPRGWSEWYASAEPEGLRLYARREWHPGQLRPGSRRLQAGRADPKGRRLRRPPGAEGATVLPLAHLHGARTSASLQIRTLRTTAAMQRNRRPATPIRSTPSRCRSPRTSTRPTSPTSRPRSGTSHA